MFCWQNVNAWSIHNKNKQNGVTSGKCPNTCGHLLDLLRKLELFVLFFDRNDEKKVQSKA